MASIAELSDDSDASLKKTFMRVSREQLLEDLAIKDKELDKCKVKVEHNTTPWWVRAIIIVASIFLLMIAIWGIVALVYANKLSNGVTGARAELAALNAEIARRLELLDDTQQTVEELRNKLSESSGTVATLRLNQIQQVLDTFGQRPTGTEKEDATQQKAVLSMTLPIGSEQGVSIPLQPVQKTNKTTEAREREQGTKIFL